MLQQEQDRKAEREKEVVQIIKKIENLVREMVEKKKKV